MPFLRTRLDNIDDPELIDAIYDICEMLGWPSNDFDSYPLFDFFQLAMTQPAKTLSLKFIAAPRVLGSKMEKLQNHKFYEVCLELNDGNSLELFDGITALSFLKQRFVSHRPKKASKPTIGDRWDAVYRQRNQNRR